MRGSRIKENKKYKVCYIRGHWWNDNEKCREKIYKKRKLMEQDERGESSGDNETDGDTKEAGVFFLFGGKYGTAVAP